MSDHEKNKIYDWQLDTDEEDFVSWEQEMFNWATEKQYEDLD